MSPTGLLVMQDGRIVEGGRDGAGIRGAAPSLYARPDRGDAALAGVGMSALAIPNGDARRLWLWSNGLTGAPGGKPDVMGIIRALGFVQIDTIRNVTQRASSYPVVAQPVLSRGDAVAAAAQA